MESDMLDYVKLRTKDLSQEALSADNVRDKGSEGRSRLL
jgi:hypothetical protein